MQACSFSRASKIIGIESNQQLCDIQRQVINRYHMSSKAEVICSDVRLQANILQSSDLIILNNVFEFFNSLEEQARYVIDAYGGTSDKGRLKR